MNTYSIWRYLLLIVLIILGLVYAAPNIYGRDPAVQISPKNSATLQGVAAKVEKVLDAQKIAYKSIGLENKGQDLLVRFKDSSVQFKAQDVISAALGNKKYTVAANLASNTPAWLQAIGATPMRWGLDLQGGIHFLMAVDVNAMIKERQQGDMHAMVTMLRQSNIHYTGVNNLAKKGIQFQFKNIGTAKNASAALDDQYQNYQFKTSNAKGLATLTATLTPAGIVSIQNYAIDQNMNILRKRVNALGVAEPVIQRQGPTHISVDLPGIQDSARAKSLIGKVATIRLQLQDVQHDANAAASGVIPFGSTLYTYDGQPVLLKNRIILRGSSIVSATASYGQDGRPSVSIRLNGEGASMFNRVTAANIGKPLATVYVQTVPVKKLVKGKVVTTHKKITKVINIATIDSALGNSFQITGLTSSKEASNLALLLRSGAYTAPLDIVSEHLVGPSLGKQNIHMGILSTEIGSLLVFLFMLFYYRAFGFFADLALLLNIVFIVAVMSLLGMTLTLPGIAGIVLTVGMAVDANVLINERIREELRAGATAQAAICAGYERAFSTIVDANVTTLIVMVVLFALGSGSVQGLAITVIVGLLTSMVTAIFFTRALVNLFYGRTNAKKISIGIKIKAK